MADSGFLPRPLSYPPSQNFALLRSESIRGIERLAHQTWTDYNVHDPGVTLLELACYGITDLGARVAHDMRELLTEIKQGVPAILADFHGAHEVLVCAPVTFNDLRKLLIDIPGVRNAWIEPHRSVRYGLDTRDEHLTFATTGPDVQALDPLNGLYDVYLEYEEFVRPGTKAFRTIGHVGPADGADADGPIEPQDKGLVFNALQDARLESVAVYPDAAGEVTIRLLDGDGNELSRRTAAARRAGAANRITLGFDLEAGRSYRIDARGTPVKLQRISGARFPFELPDVVRIVRGHPSESIYYFFFHWEVAYGSSGLSRDEVRDAAVDRLLKHRNLCEDVINVCDLQPEEIALCADIELAPEADTEAVQAEILYAMHLHISPPIRFYSIDDLLARGRTVDQIFEGPLLDHGFIDDEEFQAVRRKCEIRASDAVQKLMGIPGVVAVKNLRLLSFVDGELRAQADWMLDLDKDRFRIAVFAPERSKIVFYKQGLPYYASREVVRALLKEKKAADMEAKLKGHARELSLAPGEPKDVGAYYALQNELPTAYCLGQIRLPPSETPLRRAQQRQLKAYLMFFEQMLANFLAQLAHVKELFSWQPASRATYFTQEVPGVADFHELDHAEYRAGMAWMSFRDALEAIIEGAPVREDRKLRFLEHLVARYCEGFSEYGALMRALRANAERLIADKQRFLRDYPALGARRAQACDYRAPQYGMPVPGYQLRVYRLLGIEDAMRRRLAGHQFSVRESGGKWHFRLAGADSDPFFESVECETKAAIEVLLDFCLDIGADRSNYSERAGGTWELLRRCADDADTEVIGWTLVSGQAALDEVVAYFAQVGAAEGFHLVEHILLRPRSRRNPFLPHQPGEDVFLPVQLAGVETCDCPEASDPYSFRMSIVLPSWSPRFRDVRFRRFVEDSLRREAPAHVHARICWISHVQMQEVEVALESWTGKLAGQSQDAARCGSGDAATRTGKLPLPREAPRDREYADGLARLTEVLFGLTSVYPLARLHDCNEARGDTPQVALNFTRLGTL